MTEQADRDALRLISRIARRNPTARLVVTGCLASRDPQSILRQAPAAMVVGNEGKEGLSAMLGCRAAPAGVTELSGRSRAFVKIQDGCNMSCRFCIIPSVRPQLSSKPYAELESEVQGLITRGCPEIVLCGVRLGRYLSTDEAGRRVDLVGALEHLLELPGRFRLRLSSLEITDATDRLFALMAGSQGRLCPSLHLPLQSGSEGVLRRMGRWYSAAFYRRRAEAFQARVAHASLFADIMTGFPEESEAEHEESLGFARAVGFSGLHVFRYSRRPGTSAARSPCLDDEIVSERASQWRALDFSLRGDFAARAVGACRTVVPERSGSEALTEDFLTVRLKEPAPAGLLAVQISRAQGVNAWAEAIAAA